MTHPNRSTAADLGPSLIRTLVPFLIGGLGSWLTRQGFDINDDGAATALTMAIGYLYYVLARFLEVSSPKWGYILGFAKAPVYERPVSDGETPVGRHDTNLGGDHGAGELRLFAIVVVAVLIALLIASLI